MGSSLFDTSLEQSRNNLIGHLGDFLSVFPLYSQGERAGEYAGEAAGMMLIHAAVATGEVSDNLNTYHLFLAGTSLLAFSNPKLFVSSLTTTVAAQATKIWLNNFADTIAASGPLPRETPILDSPDVSFEFLDCAALGALHKSLEVFDLKLPLESEAKTQTDLGIVLLETALDYDLQMGHLDHALAVWGALAILAYNDVPLPTSLAIPSKYRRLLVSYLHSLADSYALSQDFAFIFN